jgi:hypothetical protein
MKRTNLYILGILTLAFIGGCSSSTTPINGPTQVTYTQSSNYKYLYNMRNAADAVDTTVATDTITSTVVATNIPYQGMSNVTELINIHTNGANPDTTYIAQSNGQFWHYNYGLEAINNNSSFTAVLGGQIQIGWVLQANFNAVAGNKWIASDTSVRVNAPVIGSTSATVVDSATEQADTSIAVNGSLVFSKHSLHKVVLTALGSPLTTTVDAYVATSEGVTLNIVHTANINASFYNGPVKGSQTLLIKGN